MTTEENKRLLALSYIAADVKAENIELEQRVHQLLGDYNEVVRQLNGKEKRKDEDSSRQTLGEMQQMRDHCYKLERMNEELKRFSEAIYSIVKDLNIYMGKGTSCGYKPGHPPVSSTACLECASCLGVIDGCGVICEKRLAEASVAFPDND